MKSQPWYSFYVEAFLPELRWYRSRGRGSTELGVGEGQHRIGSEVRGSTELAVGVRGSTELGVR